MRPAITPATVTAVAVAIATVLFAIGWLTRQDPAQKPYLHIAGGGFVANYRIAEMFYGVALKVQKPLRARSIIEVAFEDPAGGPPIVESLRVNSRTTQYSLRTPPLRYVSRDTAYRVVISLFDYTHATLIEQHERSFTSSIASTTLPERPLTIGPGYALNPQNR